uniref:MME n=1 Tax=Ascaris lumbricoides TaxID=6252 RepID=A0A0M3HVA7_ASCLU
MTTPQVKCENKDAEGTKAEKGNMALFDQGIEMKKIEEASRHRKLFLEYGQQLRHIYILRSMGALIIMLGATMVFVSALLFYRRAHCGDEWSQWTPCKNLVDVSTTSGITCFHYRAGSLRSRNASVMQIAQE